MALSLCRFRDSCWPQGLLYYLLSTVNEVILSIPMLMKFYFSYHCTLSTNEPAIIHFHHLHCHQGSTNQISPLRPYFDHHCTSSNTTFANIRYFLRDTAFLTLDHQNTLRRFTKDGAITELVECQPLKLVASWFEPSFVVEVYVRLSPVFFSDYHLHNRVMITIPLDVLAISQSLVQTIQKYTIL